MIPWWQHIPESIDPIALSIGSFSLRWYGVLFLLGWGVVFFVLFHETRKKAAAVGSGDLVDVALIGFLSAVSGGRIGYALFYDRELFSRPISLISPFDAFGSWIGIWGMSFFGALIGVSIFLWLFSRVRVVNFWKLSDFIVFPIPIALFFGRIGNFVNGELFGRVTDIPWGMYFQDVFLRHPSQLYEAFFEGIVLLFILVFIRRKKCFPGCLLFTFLIAYSVVRFFLEFFREPDMGDALLFRWMTTGQALSLALFLVSVSGFFIRRKYGTIRE